MKKILIAIVMTLSAGICFSQAKPFDKNDLKSQGYQVPATIQVPLPDSVAFITTGQLNEFLKLLNKIPHETYISLTPQQVVSELYNWARKEWEEAQKKKSNK